MSNALLLIIYGCKPSDPIDCELEKLIIVLKTSLFETENKKQLSFINVSGVSVWWWFGWRWGACLKTDVKKSFSVSEFIGTFGLCEGLISVLRCDHSLDDLFFKLTKSFLW